MQGVALFEKSHRQIKANKILPRLELLGTILEILTAAKTIIFVSYDQAQKEVICLFEESDTFLI